MILTRPFRKPFWIMRSFAAKHQKLILVAAIIGVAVFFGAKNFIPLLPKFKPSQRIGLVGQYTFFNLPNEVSRNISRGLTKLDASGQALPDVVKSWQVSEDETIYTVFLNPDSFWSDGTPIEAQDITLNLPDVELSYPEEYVVEFKLKESYSPFIQLLSQPLFKDGKLGASNYTIKSVKYRGPYLSSLELSGTSQNLTYRFYPSFEAAWLGFKLGQVDQLIDLIINPLTDNWKNKIDLKQSINYQQYLAVIFNLNDPNLSSKSLRQALAYAIKDKSPSKESRAYSPIGPNSWAYNDNVKSYEYSPAQARELFDRLEEEASISGDLTIELGTSQSFLSMAETIAESWEEVLPVKVEVKIINTIEPNFQAILIAQEIPSDPDQHALWHSTQETNISHYSDLRVDKLLEDGRKELDIKLRKSIYLDFQRFIVEDTPAIFLKHPVTYTISRK